MMKTSEELRNSLPSLQESAITIYSNYNINIGNLQDYRSEKYKEVIATLGKFSNSNIDECVLCN